MFKPHTSALLFVGKGIHGNGKQFLAFETLFKFCLSIHLIVQTTWHYLFNMFKQLLKSGCH
jgi:hypothetical protein